MPEPTTADVPKQIFRVGRGGGLLRFSEIKPVDAVLPKAGNRFDVLGGGVLYAGTDEECCYAETLARFRPTPVMREVLKEDDPGFMVVGGVPRDWRLTRALGDLKLENPLPFLDVETPETQAHLSDALAAQLVALGYTGNLDFADICNQDRRLSRAIAHHAYTAVDENGNPVYSGLRYVSRINDEWECWAIFDGTEVEEVATHHIDLNNAALQRVAKMWDLHLF